MTHFFSPVLLPNKVLNFRVLFIPPCSPLVQDIPHISLGSPHLNKSNGSLLFQNPLDELRHPTPIPSIWLGCSGFGSSPKDARKFPAEIIVPSTLIMYLILIALEGETNF